MDPFVEKQLISFAQGTASTNIEWLNNAADELGMKSFYLKTFIDNNDDAQVEIDRYKRSLIFKNVPLLSAIDKSPEERTMKAWQKIEQFVVSFEMRDMIVVSVRGIDGGLLEREDTVARAYFQQEHMALRLLRVFNPSVKVARRYKRKIYVEKEKPSEAVMISPFYQRLEMDVRNRLCELQHKKWVWLLDDEEKWVVPKLMHEVRDHPVQLEALADEVKVMVSRCRTLADTDPEERRRQEKVDAKVLKVEGLIPSHKGRDELKHKLMRLMWKIRVDFDKIVKFEPTNESMTSVLLEVEDKFTRNEILSSSSVIGRERTKRGLFQVRFEPVLSPYNQYISALMELEKECRDKALKIKEEGLIAIPESKVDRRTFVRREEAPKPTRGGQRRPSAESWLDPRKLLADEQENQDKALNRKGGRQRTMSETDISKLLADEQENQDKALNRRGRRQRTMSETDISKLLDW